MQNHLVFLKENYCQQMNQEPKIAQTAPIFKTVYQIGKNFIQNQIEKYLSHYKEIFSNENISLMLGVVERELIIRMNLNQKSDVYRIFGNHCLQRMNTFPDQAKLENILSEVLDEQLQKNKQLTNNKSQNFQKTTYHTPQQTFKQTSQGQRTLNNHQIFLNHLNPRPQFTQRSLSQRFAEQVTHYIQKLSSVQGELTYIYQHLKWQKYETFYHQKKSDCNQFICTARMFLPQDLGPQKFIQRTQKSKQKGTAKQFACVVLLKSLYFNYPQVWVYFQYLKQNKKLMYDPLLKKKSPQQLQIIRSEQKCKVNQEKVHLFLGFQKSSVKEMMQRISASAQLSFLSQRLPQGQINHRIVPNKTKHSKTQVEVNIQYRTDRQINDKIDGKTYKSQIIHLNSKVAQETSCMQAIIKMYQANLDLFSRIKCIKHFKKIKDTPKKYFMNNSQDKPKKVTLV